MRHATVQPRDDMLAFYKLFCFRQRGGVQTLVMPSYAPMYRKVSSPVWPSYTP